MEIKRVSRPSFCICGYAVETTLAENAVTLAQLYEDFFAAHRDDILETISASWPGYYGLMWYTDGKERYSYLLGREVAPDATPPEGALLKTIPAAEYALVTPPPGMNAEDAWTRFFDTAIPQAGLKQDEQHGFYIEYYPQGVDGPHELWAPVIEG